jgi:putative ABC transport system permease protein
VVGSQLLAGRRFVTILLGIFAVSALLLATVGIYGVISYSVAQRRQEIGIRMALGAAPRNVCRLIIGQGLKLTAFGLGIGLLGSLALTRVVSSFLFGVTATDPGTFAAVFAVLAIVAILASYIPAQRATRVDPMVALRHE